MLIDYSRESGLLEQLIDEFEEIAVRTRVPTISLGGSTSFLKLYRQLLDTLNHNGSLFLDIYNISRGFVQKLANLRLMCGLAKKMGIPVYVFNAFESRDMAHNFGPFFSKYYDLDGFGDFATENRFPKSVKLPKPYNEIRKTIKFYNWNRFVLREFSDYAYSEALLQLRNSGIWENNMAHVSSCPACRRVMYGPLNRSRSFWKEFRIKHYLHCISNETLNKYSTSSSAEDLDPDGYDTFFNSGGTR